MRKVKLETVNTAMRQQVANYGKAGAYYTDLDHCDAIARYLNFKEGEEYCILEPSIGNAEAVERTVKKSGNDGKHIFGVELNKSTYLEIKNKDTLESVICADFLRGTKITNKRFSFIFSNPPYGDAEEGIRLEEKFLDKIGSLSSNGALLVWIVPFSSFIRERHLRMMLNHWDVHKIMKFHKRELDKYHQIVVIASKVKFENRKELIEEYTYKFNEEGIEGIDEIDFSYNGKQYDILPSKTSEINIFAAKDFDYDEFYEYQKTQDILDNFNSFFKTEAYISTKKEQPPTMPKKDLLCIESYGSGYCMAGGKGQRHLYRGTAKIVQDNIIEEATEEGKKNVVHVITRTSVQSKIIEESGKITTF